MWEGISSLHKTDQNIFPKYMPHCTDSTTRFELCWVNIQVSGSRYIY